MKKLSNNRENASPAASITLINSSEAKQVKIAVTGRVTVEFRIKRITE